MHILSSWLIPLHSAKFPEVARQLTLTVYIKEPALYQEKMPEKIIPSKPTVHIGKLNNRWKKKKTFHTNESNTANKTVCILEKTMQLFHAIFPVSFDVADIKTSSSGLGLRSQTRGKGYSTRFYAERISYYYQTPYFICTLLHEISRHVNFAILSFEYFAAFKISRFFEHFVF